MFDGQYLFIVILLARNNTCTEPYAMLTSNLCGWSDMFLLLRIGGDKSSGALYLELYLCVYLVLILIQRMGARFQIAIRVHTWLRGCLSKTRRYVCYLLGLPVLKRNTWASIH